MTLHHVLRFRRLSVPVAFYGLNPISQLQKSISDTSNHHEGKRTHMYSLCAECTAAALLQRHRTMMEDSTSRAASNWRQKHRRDIAYGVTAIKLGIQQQKMEDGVLTAKPNAEALLLMAETAAMHTKKRSFNLLCNNNCTVLLYTQWPLYCKPLPCRLLLYCCRLLPIQMTPSFTVLLSPSFLFALLALMNIYFCFILYYAFYYSASVCDKCLTYVNTITSLLNTSTAGLLVDCWPYFFMLMTSIFIVKMR